MTKAYELAKSYLKKHIVAEEKFGLGPFLESKEFEVLAAPAQAAGNIILKADKPLENSYLACKTISKNLKHDIMLHNPDLNPGIFMYKDRGWHYWVEITDPKSGERIQIDPTPWFSCLNPGHKGQEADDEESVDILIVTKNLGRPFSTKKYGDRFISLYFHGFFRRLYENIIVKKFDPKWPTCRFRIFAALQKNFGARAEKLFGLALEIHDLDLLKTRIGAGDTLDGLIINKAIKIAVTKPGKNDFIEEYYESLDQIEKRADRNENRELFKEIERNLPRVMILLRKINPLLRVYGKEDEYADIRNGTYAAHPTSYLLS